MIEFMSWYVPGDTLVRCGGDGGCGSLVGDTNQHLKFHERIDKIEAVSAKPDLPVPLPRVKGTW